MKPEDSPNGALLASPAEKKLLAKLARAGDADQIRKLLTAAAPDNDPHALLADLARRGKLGREEAMVEILQQTAAELDPSAIHGFFEGLDNSEPSYSWNLPGFEAEELPILARSYARHADYWDSATVSPMLEGALALVRARAGKPVDDAVRQRVIDELAANPLGFGGLPDNAYQLGITPKEWGQKTLPIVLGSRAGLVVRRASIEALVQAPWPEARRILSGRYDGRSFVEILTRRTEPPEEVLAFAEEVRESAEDTDAVAFLIIAVLRRIAPAHLPLPPHWDHDVASAVVGFRSDRAAFAESFAGAERSFSALRRHAIIRAAVKDDNGHFAYALLRHAWDADLFAAALASRKTKPLTVSVYFDESESLGLVGTRALPLLMQEFEVAVKRPETGLASALWHAILVGVATIEPAARDPRHMQLLLDPGFKLGAQAQFHCWQYWQRLLRSLPHTERQAIVQTWKTLNTDAWDRCIPDELRRALL